MDLMPDNDLEEIERTVAAFLSTRCPVRGFGHEHVTPGPEIDDRLWRECAGLGWLGLGLPEDVGGAGFSVVEESVLFREIGRQVVAGPFLPTVLAGHVAYSAGDHGLASSIAAGELRAALAIPTTPVQPDDSVSMDFTAVHSDDAELVVVCGATGSFLLAAGDCSLVPVDSVDGSVRCASGRVDGARPSVQTTHRVRDRALVLAASLSAGLASGVLHTTVDYVKQRHQFGKPVGSYQAVKHPLADAAVRVEGVEAQIAYAAVAVRDGLAGATREALVAKWAADQAAVLNSAVGVQAHGGMGFTAEAVPYRYVLRAHLMSRLVGSRTTLLDEIVASK